MTTRQRAWLPALVDANVWLAGAWARHRHHRRAKAWLDQQEDDLAFCRVTPLALLRLITNPAVTGPDALSRRAAWERVEQLMADSRVRFLTEPDGLVPLWVAFSKREDPHHLLWTDDYVAAFAQAADADFITIDEPFRTRYPSVRVIVLSRQQALELAICGPSGDISSRCSIVRATIC